MQPHCSPIRSTAYEVSFFFEALAGLPPHASRALMNRQTIANEPVCPRPVAFEYKTESARCTHRSKRHNDPGFFFAELPGEDTIPAYATLCTP